MKSDYRDTCGIVSPKGISQYHSMTPYLAGGPVYLTATQYANSYLRSTAVKKTVSIINGNNDITIPLSKFDANKDIFAAANICEYHLKSGSNIALDIQIRQFVNPLINSGRLIIYGGKYGFDAVLYDSFLTPIPSPGKVFTAPCGVATILLQSNNSDGNVDYFLDFGYKVSESDSMTGRACSLYCKSNLLFSCFILYLITRYLFFIVLDINFKLLILSLLIFIID